MSALKQVCTSRVERGMLCIRNIPPPKKKVQIIENESNMAFLYFLYFSNLAVVHLYYFCQGKCFLLLLLLLDDMY